MKSHGQAALSCLVAGALVSCGHAQSLGDSQHALAVTAKRARVCYRGTQLLAGHFEKPGQTQTFSMTLEVSPSPGAAALVASIWAADAPDDVDREQVWLDRDRVIRASSEAPAAEASKWEAAWAQKLARLGETVQVQRAPHPTFGDVVERAQPGALTMLDGVSAPGKLSLAHAAESAAWTAELERERCPEATALTELPRVTAPTAADAITWSTPAAGVNLASLHDSQIVSLVLELSDSLIVCESGLTVRQGEQLIDALAERFPKKPVAHVFFSHHHPHYTGGLRAFIAAGAVIHAPVHNAHFVEQLAALPFELAPDRLARNKAAARIETFDSKLELRDAGRVVIEAFDIGSESNHTQEYVVMYLPDHKLLFEGDLGWFVEPNGQLRASRRAQGLLQASTSRGLAVERFVQSWPLMGERQVIPASTLQGLVKR